MLQTLFDFILFLPRKIFSWFLDAILYLLNNLPGADSVNNIFNTIQSSWNSFPPFVHFLFEICQFNNGMKMITAALLLRFCIKIFPTVG